MRPALSLLVEHELQGGKGHIAVKSRFVSVEEGRKSLSANNGPRSVGHALVVVSRGEVGVVIAALKLEASLENFRWYVDDRGGKVAEEP